MMKSLLQIAKDDCVRARQLLLAAKEDEACLEGAAFFTHQAIEKALNNAICENDEDDYRCAFGEGYDVYLLTSRYYIVNKMGKTDYVPEWLDYNTAKRLDEWYTRLYAIDDVHDKKDTYEIVEDYLTRTELWLERLLT